MDDYVLLVGKLKEYIFNNNVESKKILNQK